jgi:hypothetical protein
MKLHFFGQKWLWFGFAALCALGVVLGYLAHPVDELTALRSLHPIESVRLDDKIHLWTLDFKVAPQIVMAKLPLPLGARSDDYIPPRPRSIGLREFPSGNLFSLSVFDRRYANVRAGVTCSVTVVEQPQRPWYSRSWIALRQRLGFR